MSAILSVVFATLCLAVSAEAQTYNLAIHQLSTARMDSSITHEAQQELQRLLSPAGIRVTWQNASHATTAVPFDRLAVVSFDGECAVNELSAISSWASQTKKLADTVVGKEGDVRPFFHVDCEHVIPSLRPLLDRVSVPTRNRILGRAIARIMAHEIYHILSQETDHSDSGIAKPSFSTEDLTAERLDFNLPSLDRMRYRISRLAAEHLLDVSEPGAVASHAVRTGFLGRTRD